MRWILACAAMLAVANCGPQGSTSSLADPNVYTDRKFGVTWRVPDGWHILDSAGVQQVRQAGVDAVSNSEEGRRRAAETAINARTVIFSIFEHELGADVDFNPSVAATATRIPGGVDASSRSYLENQGRLMSQVSVPVEVLGEPESYVIGGETFDVLHLKMTLGGLDVSQNKYAARHGDFMISITQTYLSDEQHKATDQLLKDIRFDW
jgi:hypothetical protein